MKKHLFFAFVLSSVIGSVNAQLPVSTTPQNRSVYLEEFTGIHCGYCPDGHRIGTQIHDADPSRVVLVNIHSGSFANAAAGEPDFKTTWGTAIDGMPGMGITGYPAGNVNRRVATSGAQSPGGMASSRSAWQSLSTSVKAMSAYCNVACQGTLDPQTRVLTVDVEVYYTANAPVATNSLNVFLLESKIHGIQSNYGNYNPTNYNEDGSYNHNHVLRASLTGNFGVTIPNTTSTTLFTTQLTYTIPATYGASGKTTTPDFENMELVVFVTETDRDVIQAANGPVNMLIDAKAKALDLESMVCGNAVAPIVTIENNGINAITTLTITPKIDNVAKAPTVWTGNLAAGATTTVMLNSISGTGGGGHAFTYMISGDGYTGNNSGSGSYYAATDYNNTTVAEDFSVTTFPPTQWGMVNSDGGTKTWSRIVRNNIGGYNLSSQCAKYDFFQNTVIGDKDELYLPPMDMTGAEAPEIFFDVAYAQRTFSSNDQLEVMASKDCGATWTTVYSSAGSALTNTTPISYSFAPSSSDPSEWRTEVASMTGFNVNEVIVKFVVTNDNGNNLYLDNVNLWQKNPNGINKVQAAKLNVSMYPNPSNGVTKLSINAAQAGEATISVMNTLGQVVMTKSTTLNNGYNAIEFNVNELSTGVYNVSIQSAGGSTVKKLNVIK